MSVREYSLKVDFYFQREETIENSSGINADNFLVFRHIYIPCVWQVSFSF